MTAPHSRRDHLWRDPRAIPHLIRVRSKSVSLSTHVRRPRYVTWSYDHGKDKLVSSLFILQCFDVTDRDFDLFTRKNIRDRLREDVRSLLIQKTRHLAVCFCCLVNSLSFFAWKNLSPNGTTANRHSHVVDSGILRKWKCVDRFNLVLEWILEFLRDADAREESTNL